MPPADQLAFAAAHFPPKMADNIQIERNCPDRLYQLVAQAVVDAHGWDNSAHDYGVWRRAYGPERFTLFMAVDKGGTRVGEKQQIAGKFSPEPPGGLDEFVQALGLVGPAQHVLCASPVQRQANRAQAEQ
jgi:hypothetical protein